MAKRNPLSAKQNIWFDAQQVDNTDLSLEQDFNDTITSGLINNHLGSGVLLETLVDNIIYDSLLESGHLDGVANYAQTQPSDNNFGNQLEIVLTDSLAASKKTIKVCIIGLDFESNLQYETFTFNTNESQISERHFASVLLILFNDFIGDDTLSFNLGGRIIIKECKALSLSRSVKMVAQDIEPSLFFRDFFVDGFSSLQALLVSALPLYNIDSLNIYTTVKDFQSLDVNDVTTQIGQKFQATTNNIQKITLLMSVINEVVGSETDLAWNGDLVVSIYQLQSNIQYSTDIAPGLEIEFTPSNIPLAQISFDYNSLSSSGTVLDGVPQPIDFVFSNSSIAAGNILVPGNYYAFTVKRSGSANKCKILLVTGGDHTANSRVTIFTGSVWVDLPEQDLWFRVYTDAAKVSDGQAYDLGHGITVAKTTIDDTTATIDYCIKNLQFKGSELFKAVISSTTTKTDIVQDQKTGNPVLSRKEYTPSINLLNIIDIINLEAVSEPVVLGSIVDKNIKFFDSISTTINSNLYTSTIINNEVFIKIITDTGDARYDSSVEELKVHLLNGYLNGSKFIPNTTDSTKYYRVADASLLTMIVGDVNGDGIIDEDDLTLLNTYLDYNLNIGLPQDSTVTTDTFTTTFTNGYNTLTQPFITQLSGVSFQLVDSSDNVAYAGTDGVLLADPNDNSLANFASLSVNFALITGISSYKLVLLIPSVMSDYGGFEITSSVSGILTIRKNYLNAEVLLQILRSDIDTDLIITSSDASLLNNYINRLNVGGYYSRIGTTFEVIKLSLETFSDRADDYSPVVLNRATTIHITPDVFLTDGYYDSHNFTFNPSPISFVKQLLWEEYLVLTTSDSKLVPCIFGTNTNEVTPSCTNTSLDPVKYSSQYELPPGRNDLLAPNNLILGEEIQRPNGDLYKVDFEVGTITLEVPEGLLDVEKTINVMDYFVADYGSGLTRFGFPAMKFADCSYATNASLTNNQIRFSVSMQSFSPNTNGLDIDGYYGAIVDGKMGVAIDYTTGLLTLNFTNLYEDAVKPSGNTKIQINVFLKKGGFNNQAVFIDSAKLINLLT